MRKYCLSLAFKIDVILRGSTENDENTDETEESYNSDDEIFDSDFN